MTGKWPFNPSKRTAHHTLEESSPVCVHHPWSYPCSSQYRRYLGITLSHDLSWKAHVEAATKKASNSLAFLRRNLYNCSSQINAMTYKSLVRPTLKYASTVSDPQTQACIQQLETVQHKAARFVKGDNHTPSSTSQMITDLGWTSLLQRRQQAKLHIEPHSPRAYWDPPNT